VCLAALVVASFNIPERGDSITAVTLLAYLCSDSYKRIRLSIGLSHNYQAPTRGAVLLSRHGWRGTQGMMSARAMIASMRSQGLTGRMMEAVVKMKTPLLVMKMRRKRLLPGQSDSCWITFSFHLLLLLIKLAKKQILTLSRHKKLALMCLLLHHLNRLPSVLKYQVVVRWD
jgi:hypothetical protein